MDYNFNSTHCIREAHAFGSDTYFNICSGVNHVVPWGSMDYFYNILGLTVIGLMVSALVGAVAIIAYAIYTEYREYKELTA